MTRLALAAIIVIVVAFAIWPILLALLLFRELSGTRKTAHVWSFIANSAALFVVLFVLRHSFGITRTTFLAGWCGWSLLLGVILWRCGNPQQSLATLWKRWRGAIVIGVTMVITGCTLFGQEHFLQCFNGDGTEAYELARSLTNHFLPYWEIETIGRFGTPITNPAVINSYWTCAFQLLLGASEFSTRLPYWIFVFGIFMVACRLSAPSHTYSTVALPVALVLLLITLWYSFYTGYYPYMADIASPGVQDMLFTLFVLLSFDALRNGDHAGWVAAMLFASLISYAGPIFFYLTAAAAFLWQPTDRKTLVRATWASTSLFVAVALLYLAWGWHTGVLYGWWTTLLVEYAADYFGRETGGISHLHSSMLYPIYFVLGCGGVAVLGLVRAWKTSAWDRTVACVVVGYLAIILGSASKNLHYLGPLLPLPMILWLRATDLNRKRASRWIIGLTCLSVVLCSLYTWPRDRHLFTKNRELGDLTVFYTDSYEEACEYAELITPLCEKGVVPWSVGKHTWVQYAQLDGSRTELRSIVVREGPAPSDAYHLVERSAEGVSVYMKDQSSMALLEPSSVPAPSRFPKILAPIAPRMP